MQMKLKSILLGAALLLGASGVAKADKGMWLLNELATTSGYTTLWGTTRTRDRDDQGLPGRPHPFARAQGCSGHPVGRLAEGSGDLSRRLGGDAFLLDGR